jgi:hypothetical protein
MPEETMKGMESQKKETARDGDLIIETFNVNNLINLDNVVKVNGRAIDGSVVGDFHSLRCDTFVEYHVTKGTLHITSISTEGNKVTYGREVIGKVDKGVAGLRDSGITEVISRMTGIGRWNDIVVEVSEKYEINDKFAKVIPGAVASGTKLSEARGSETSLSSMRRS